MFPQKQVIYSTQEKWPGHIARMDENKPSPNILFGNLRGQRGRRRRILR